MNDDEFDKAVGEAIDKIPEPFRGRIQNIAFLVEEEPTAEQRVQLKLHPGETLFGLYEGVPLPKRGGAQKLLPDKITIFKNPILTAHQGTTEIQKQIDKTVWHEVAHYFGLDHERIHQIEKRHLG